MVLHCLLDHIRQTCHMFQSQQMRAPRSIWTIPDILALLQAVMQNALMPLP